MQMCDIFSPETVVIRHKIELWVVWMTTWARFCDHRRPHVAVSLQGEMPRSTTAAGMFREVMAHSGRSSQSHTHALDNAIEPCDAPPPRGHQRGEKSLLLDQNFPIP